MNVIDLLSTDSEEETSIKPLKKVATRMIRDDFIEILDSDDEDTDIDRKPAATNCGTSRARTEENLPPAQQNRQRLASLSSSPDDRKPRATKNRLK